MPSQNNLTNVAGKPNSFQRKFKIHVRPPDCLQNTKELQPQLQDQFIFNLAHCSSCKMLDGDNYDKTCTSNKMVD